MATGDITNNIKSFIIEAFAASSLLAQDTVPALKEMGAIPNGSWDEINTIIALTINEHSINIAPLKPGAQL